MLAQAHARLAASGLSNLEFVFADAENLEFPPGSFDRIYCASAFFWMLDPVAALKHWRDLVKPGGSVGFHALPDTSYVWVSVARDVLAAYGISYALIRPTGTIDKTRQLLVEAGYRNIDIREERLGQFISLDQAKNAWLKRDEFSPGQHSNPLQNVSPEIVAQAQHDYEARIEALNTSKGVWNDLTTYYIYGQK